jgi:hypothetical protein
MLLAFDLAARDGRTIAAAEIERALRPGFTFGSPLAVDEPLLALGVPVALRGDLCAEAALSIY